jgi:hypothetical protein
MEKVKDTVCGMEVEKEEALIQSKNLLLLQRCLQKQIRRKFRKVCKKRRSRMLLRSIKGKAF